MTKQASFNRKSLGGTSLIEYMILMIIIMGAAYIMKGYIQNGIFAQRKIVGDSFAFGRQYDARRTTVCKQDFTYVFDEVANQAIAVPGNFYDEDCYHTRLMRPLSQGGCSAGDFACEDRVKNLCINDYCNQ